MIKNIIQIENKAVYNKPPLLNKLESLLTVSSFPKNWTIIKGKAKIELAKIGGITPETFIFIGI